VGLGDMGDREIEWLGGSSGQRRHGEVRERESENGLLVCSLKVGRWAGVEARGGGGGWMVRTTGFSEGGVRGVRRSGDHKGVKMWGVWRFGFVGDGGGGVRESGVPKGPLSLFQSRFFYPCLAKKIVNIGFVRRLQTKRRQEN